LPVTPKGQNIISKVADLINPISGNWDEELVRATFWVQDADIILGTPIRDDIEDFYAWQPDPMGVFSVKSAYKIHVQMMRKASATRPGAPSEADPVWAKIWALPCPMKVKQFAWRFTHNRLPLRLNIKRRGMEIDTLCPMCHRQDEDGTHIFLRCKQVRACWRLMQMEELRTKLCECANAREMMWAVLQLSTEIQLKVLILCWQWWSARNSANAGDKRRKPEAVCSLTSKWVADSKEFFLKGVSASLKQGTKWSRPTGDTLKINTDGSYFPGTNHGGWGFIIRDADGDVRGSGYGHLQHIRDPLRAEAEACVQAIQAAASWGMTRIHIETDSTTLAEALQSSKYDRMTNGVIFKEARAFIRLNFSSCVSSYCPRTCNKAAHVLAAMGARCERDEMLFMADAPPDTVNSLVASNCAVSFE
jgi:ribonuclease HI